MSNVDQARSPASATLKRLAPYIVAALALGWVLYHTDGKQLLAALRHAPIGLFVGVSTVLLVLNWMADTFAMTSVFGWFGCKVPYFDLLIVRGSTYLLAILNYHIGQAAIVGYLYRICKVPFLRATGWILFIIGINVGTLFLLSSAGASTASGELKLLRLVPLACAVGVVVYGALLLIKPRILAERRLLAPLFEMGIIGHVKGVLVRLPHIGVLIVWQFLCLRMFGIAVTPLSALLYLPAYFAVSALPVNVNGLGVAQLVAVAFFAPFASVPPGTVDIAAAQKASVMACSLSVQTFSILHQLVLGFISLRIAGARGLLVQAAPPEAEAQASSAAAQ
jgi:hypothetical protein